MEAEKLKQMPALVNTADNPYGKAMRLANLVYSADDWAKMHRGEEVPDKISALTPEQIEHFKKTGTLIPAK